jgi:nucleolin
MRRFQLRRSALRVLSSAPSSYIAKPRTFTTLSSSIRVPRQSTALAFQRRWATNEAEAKKEEEKDTPISEIQATPEEEVENAIQSDNAAEFAVDSEIQASESAAPEGQSAVDSALHSVTEAASNAAETVKETARGTYQSATGFASARSEDSAARRAPREGSLIPKPTIYIGNLFFDVTENDLVKELARFGTITKCRLMRDSRGLSKGSATFSSQWFSPS